MFNGYKVNGLENNSPDADLSVIGINNKATYLGFNLVAATSLEDIVSNSVASFQDYNPAEDEFDLANIHEADINTFLKSQELFGNKFFLTREVADDEYKVSYIALDNAYINLTDENAYMSLGLNLNGLETIITLAMANDETNTDPENSSTTLKIFILARKRKVSTFQTKQEASYTKLLQKRFKMVHLHSLTMAR